MPIRAVPVQPQGVPGHLTITKHLRVCFLAPSSVKRQASIVIGVPPRPIDWWSWEELHSPLGGKVPKRPSVDPREEDLESKEPQPQKRPRGRPRRTEVRHSIQRYRLKPAQRRKARSTNSSKRCKQSQSTSFTEERPLLTRNRKNSASDLSFGRELVDNIPSSDQTQHAMPSALIVPKKMRLMTSTISPHLLSPAEQPDILPRLHPYHKVPTMLKLDLKVSGRSCGRATMAPERGQFLISEIESGSQPRNH